jgi:flagellar hook-associated protein 1 FlgK
MSLDAALLTAASGLRAATRSLAAVSNNVANADVAGYTRKVAPQQTLVADGIGMGVRTLERQRAVDTLLVDRLAQARATATASRERAEGLAEVDRLHGDPALGSQIGALTGALRDGFLTLSSQPQDASRQMVVVDAAASLAAEVNRVADGLVQQRQSAHDRLVDVVETANADLSELARLDEQIKRMTALGQSTAELEDARDRTLGSLAENVGLYPLRQADGGVLLYGSGGIVVTPRSGARFELADATIGPRSAFDGASGDIPALLLRDGGPAAAPRDVTGMLSESRAAALIDLRDGTLPRMQAELDMFAHSLATRFQQQGLALFTDATGAVPENVLTPDATVLAGLAGQLTVNPAVLAEPRLIRDGTHDVLAADPEPRGEPFTANDPAAGGPEGFDALIGRILDHGFGTTRAPGVAHVAPPQTGLGPLGDLSAGFGFPVALTDFAGTLVVQQSTARVAAESSADVAQSLQETLGQRVAQNSGVDVDAELALMLELQQAYAANAQVLAAADEMWRTLLSAVR